jgi:nucleoside 2-deoxyribosyltransferase
MIMDLQAFEQEKRKKVEELKALCESNQISQSEFEELAQDELDIEKITEMLDTEEKKIAVEKTLLAIKTAIGLIK